MIDRFLRLAALCCLLLLLAPQATPTSAAGPPVLTLPTPPGETWKVIQGYNCGSHDGWGRLSFDLVNNNGRTRSAPVYAAADGTFWYWGANSGTLILSHGDGYYTMYTHMQSVIDRSRGSFIKRGTWIGSVGSVGAEWTVPHLHFTFFYGEGAYARNRRPLPLKFAEGYDFPDEGKCNNHGGSLVVAQGAQAAEVAPAIEWAGQPEEGWSSSGTIEWTVQDDDALGYSYGWNADPGGNSPTTQSTSGVAELSQPGRQTIYVRAWDQAGNQTLASREIRFDPQPPTFRVAKPADLSYSAGSPVVLSWPAAGDEHSGVKGYQIYTGLDPNGTSEWFVSQPQVDLGVLGAGHFYLRVRAQDAAGNFSPWSTVAAVEIR